MPARRTSRSARSGPVDDRRVVIHPTEPCLPSRIRRADRNATRKGASTALSGARPRGRS